MRIKALLAALLVAGLAVSAAIAGPPPGRGKGKRDRDRGAVTQTSTSDSTSTSTEEPTEESDERGKRGKGKARAKQASCRPTVSFILKGEFVSASVSATGEGSFAMLVKRANKHGRQFVGKQVTVETGRFTKMKRRGPSSLDKLEAGDRLVVQVRGCKAASQEGSEGTDGSAASVESKLYAKRVVAHPKKSGDDEGDDESTSTSTSTSTATTTTDSTSTSTSTSTETTTTTSP